MKLILTILMLTNLFAHQNCCHHTERKWHAQLSLATTNTTRSYTPTNHHKGLSLDHSHLSAAGPAGDYLDASASMAFNTSQKSISRKVKFNAKTEELALKTTAKTHEFFSAKAGRFASYISPENQKSCCGAAFIKRPLLYRGFLGGHLIDNGAHFDHKMHADDTKEITLGFEAFQGKGLITKSNKAAGIFTFIARHKNNFHNNHSIDLSCSYLLNTLYNQNPAKTSGHIGCCQAGSYTGQNMLMANAELISNLSDNISHNLSFECARISKLAKRFGTGKNHTAYNLGSVTSFKNLNIGTLQAGVRFDRLRGMKFCHHGGVAYFSKTIEKTAMLGWQPNQNHTFKFEYTNQNLKNQKNNNIVQFKYNFAVSIF
jgi:hypothetical protein